MEYAEMSGLYVVLELGVGRKKFTIRTTCICTTCVCLHLHNLHLHNLHLHNLHLHLHNLHLHLHNLHLHLHLHNKTAWAWSMLKCPVCMYVVLELEGRHSRPQTQKNRKEWTCRCGTVGQKMRLHLHLHNFHLHLHKLHLHKLHLHKLLFAQLAFA